MRGEPAGQQLGAVGTRTGPECCVLRPSWPREGCGPFPRLKGHFVQNTLLCDAYTDELLGLLIWEAVAGMVILLALVQIVRTPRQWFAYGLASKVAWVITSWWFAWHSGLASLPVGALAALWHIRGMRRRQEAGEALGVPFAAGTPFDQEVR